MPLEIRSRDDLTIVPIHILHNPELSLETKGAAAVMYSYADLYCTTFELAQLLGVDENTLKNSFVICKTRAMRTSLTYLKKLEFMVKRRNVAQPI